MALDEEGTEHDTVPLPDAESPVANQDSEAELEGDVDSIADTGSEAADELEDDRRSPAATSGRSKGLIAAAVARLAGW